MLACAVSSCRRTDVPRPDGAKAAPAPRFWLRDATLGPAAGAPAHVIHGPVLVELLPGARVRSVEPRNAFEGVIENPLIREPADRAGLMLYARRIADMHYGAPGGPIIGRLHPGAFVGVAAHDDKYLRIAVPRYRATPPLLAFVERDALGPEPVPEVAPERRGKLLRDYPLPLWADTGYLTSLLCGEFRLLGRRDIASQYFDGIELVGRVDGAEWLLEGDHGRGPAPCPHRLVYRGPRGLLEQNGKDGLDSIDVAEVPPGFLSPNPTATDPIADALARSSSVYWLVETKRGLLCHEWQFTDKRPAARDTYDFEGTLRRKRDPTLGAHFPLEYRAPGHDRNTGSLLLLGPHFKDGGYKCGQSYGILGADDAVIYVLNPGLVPSEPLPSGKDLVAFDPADVERWFRTPNACESARQAAAPAIAKDRAAADRFGVHFDCYDELSN